MTGGSRDNERNPYGSLKRTPKDLARNITNGNFQGQFPVQKRVPNLGTSAFLGTDYSSDTSPVSGWRKYSLPQTNRLLSSDPADYAHLYNGYDHSQWRPNQGNVGQLRKLSNASQPEIHHYRTHSADAADTQSDKGGYSSASFLTKRDSETNTDQSHLLDTSMRRMQTQRAHSAGGQVTYGYRRPLSNTSTTSVGSNKSTGSNSGKTSTVGSRLAKHGVLVEGQTNGKSMDANGGSSIPRPGSATGMRATTPGGGNPRTDMGPEAYSSATLERKKKGLNGAPKSSSAAQTDPGELYKSNTLGRTKKVFGSRNSLSKTQSQGENGSLCSSTIISNPHATYSKAGPQSPQNGSNNGTYVTMEYGSPRNSGAGQGVWLKTPNGTVGMSETESMESISSHASSIQAQIQQARALSGASARILAHRDGQGGAPNGLSRSNSLKSSQSDCVYAGAQHSMSEDITRTNSFSQLPSPPAPSSPTPSNSSHSSSRFTYPMTAAYGSSSSALMPNASMVRSNTQSCLPYGSLALSKINKEEDGSRECCVFVTLSWHQQVPKKPVQKKIVKMSSLLKCIKRQLFGQILKTFSFKILNTHKIPKALTSTNLRQLEVLHFFLI